MKITNRKAASKMKRIFFLVCVLIAIVMLVAFLLDYILIKFALVGIGSLWFLFFFVADFQYIEFLDENNRIILRYYKAIGFGQREFNSIEFPQKLLKNAYFENSIFGKMSDLTFVVNTKRGAAEYPSVSLSAVPIEDRKRIQESLNKILGI